jgi:hypothetical protein
MTVSTASRDAACTARRSDAESGDAQPTDRDDTRSGGRGSGSNGPLERITVNLTGRASRALDLATELTGDTKTDTVNRALQVYAYMEQITARGGSVYTREAAVAALELLKVF